MTLMDLLPSYWKDIKEMEQLQEAAGAEYHEALLNERDCFAQAFIATATWGLDDWEALVGLPKSSASYEDRRIAILAKLQGTSTLTLDTLKSFLESASGGAVLLEEKYAEHLINITFAGVIGPPAALDSITSSLQTMMPAHLTWQYFFVYKLWKDTITHNWQFYSTRRWNDLKMGVD